MKLTTRLYECTICKHQIEIQTNHQGECYPLCKGSCYQIIEGDNITNGGFRTPIQTPHKFIKDEQDI